MKYYKNLLKNSFFLIVAFLFLCSVNYAIKQSEQTLQLKGHISIQKDLKNIPEFTVLFGGVQVKSNEDGFFSLPILQSQVDNVSILICEKFKTRFQKNKKGQTNTISAQYLTSEIEYRYFICKIDENEKINWEESFLNNYEITDNCVVLIMRPDLVASVEAWDIVLPTGIKNLAKINLRDDISEKELFETSAKSLLGVAFDIRGFSGVMTESTKRIEGTNLIKVSMAQ